MATKNAKEAAKFFFKVAKANLGSMRKANQGVFTITAAANSDYDDPCSVMKKVRVVTTVQFFLE